MKSVEYSGINCKYDERSGLVHGKVNGEDVFAVVEQCPICGQLYGTGLAYRKGEQVFEIARDYARQDLYRHMHEEHIVRYRAEIIDTEPASYIVLDKSSWTHDESEAIEEGFELLKKFDEKKVRLNIREAFQA